jgi:hypothetical protein
MVDTHRLDNWGLYSVALVIGTILFFLVFFFAKNVAVFEEEELLKSQFESSYAIFKDSYLYSHSEVLCQEENLAKVSEDLAYHREIIANLEERLGKNDEQVIFQKKFYTLVLLNHLDFIKEYNKKCNANIQTILFFYSNLEEEVDKSESVGLLVDYVSEKYPSVQVYAIDFNLEDSLVTNVLTRYNIESVPTVLVDEKHLIVNPQNSNEIEAYLN